MNISMRFWKLKKGWKVVPLNLCWCSKLPIIFTLQFLVLFNMIALRLTNIDKHIYALQISSDLNMIDDRLICCIRFSTFHILSHNSKSKEKFCVSLKSKPIAWQKLICFKTILKDIEFSSTFENGRVLYVLCPSHSTAIYGRKKDY